MAIQRFLPQSDALMENFGATVYVAQLYERGLQNILTGLERIPKADFKIPPDIDRSQDGFINECVGPMLHILQSQARIDHRTRQILWRAHRQRNELIHRFLVENAVDMLNDAGRASINDKLERMYKNISHAHAIIMRLAEKIFAELGITPEYVAKQIAEYRRLADQKSLDEE